MKVSYCSSCKGRLSQLKNTLMPNLSSLDKIDAEWIIVDYGCPDKVKEVLFELPEVLPYLISGKLKVYSFNKNIPFHKSLSKNLSHSVATGDVVFNLDIDNYIGDSYKYLSQLTSKEYLETNIIKSGYYGRIGLYRSVFEKLGGYDLELDVVGFEDINLVKRLNKIKLKRIVENDIRTPQSNSVQDTLKYVDSDKTPSQIYANSKKISDDKLRKGGILVNPKGSLFYDDEDMSIYLERVFH